MAFQPPPPVLYARPTATTSAGKTRVKLSRDMWILAIGQALSGTVGSLLTAVSSLAGAALATNDALATLPVTASVGGAFLMTYPAATIMGRLGRRFGFFLKAVIGILGGLTAMTALILHMFAMLVLGCFLLGIFSAFSLYYRFAAIDAATSPDQRARAVALITGAGLIGGVGGPYLAERFDAILHTPFLSAFGILTVICGLIAFSQIFLSSDLGRVPRASTDRVRAERFVPSAAFLAASIVCAVGSAAMTLTMNAAPLSLAHRPSLASHTTLVLQAHFACMYLPSFFNTTLIRKVGLHGLIAVGLGALLVMATSAQLFSESPLLYLLQLSLSGIGWNFVFNGGTLLVAETFSDAVRTQAQGVNSLIVYGANVVASLAAGVLVVRFNWQIVNLACVPLIIAGTLGLAAFRNRTITHPKRRTAL